jgi:hypothetical protein
MSVNNETSESFLNNFVNSLTIPQKTREKAENRYESIGNWLNRPDSTLIDFKPEIYSQGSIRLNTTIKPLNEDGEYDLDAVCCLSNLSVNTLTQKQLKELIGYELDLYIKSNNFKKPLDEGKRCWTIEYSDSEQFHMDILPSVPDEVGFRSMLSEHSISNEELDRLHTSTAISITDNTSYNYSYISADWNKSNPKGYYEWFKQRCIVQKVSKSFLALESTHENIEEIPNQTTLLPLQKAIMILKRHRDIMFQYDSEHKPISIIITTLAAKAYKGTEKLKETLDDIINGMLQEMTCDINNNCEVLNPINPNENFADKWKNEPIKRENFRKWVQQLKTDYAYLSSNNYENNKTLLENSFGSKSIQKAYSDSFGIIKNLTIKAKELLSLTHVQKPNWDMSNVIYSVNITCQKSKNGMLTQNIKSGEPIEKNWNLRFKAHFDGYGSGRKFYWQVANSGYEAIQANCLRGDFYDGTIEKGGKERKESTSYTGSHFVRCFVVQNNQCVAVSEPFIVNII